MRRNCNLELCLFPPYHTSANRHNQCNLVEEEDHSDKRLTTQNQQQPLTIFYDGKICVTDVTEFQAKSILMMANKKLQESVNTPTPRGSEPSTPTIVYSPNQLYSPAGLGPGPRLSMKRCLQRFLQKRKNRVLEASPYNH
ncbi:protein TIFY 5A [Cicer arietinum]|uniref:Protein TIFY n=1 Tax=Cicer arietinum TaxID=3827 RepID=A0A1S2XAH0_CICAR|nr:protein TIFY 5A [Cicer arietinum]